MAGKNLLNSVQVKIPRSNVFDLSHDVKLSGNMGYLIPTLVQECVPSDKFNLGCDSLVRLAPMVAPVMHRMDVYHEYFFVPSRLLWDNFESYMENGGVSGNPPAFPFITVEPQAGGITDPTPGTLANYMGIPPGLNSDQATPTNINAMPFAAYQLIYNEYYRDQNLQSERNYALVDGDNTSNLDLYEIRKRAWEHDYFTSNLPFAQKGPVVNMPMNQIGDVQVMFNDPTGTQNASYTSTTGDGVFINTGDATPNVTDQHLYAETSALNSIAPNINDLRVAERVQEWFEKMARVGTRYVELVRGFFGVRSSDARFQRPEYITGSKSPIVISEVLQTSSTDSEPTPQGNMAGHSVGVQSGKMGTYYCEEHGYIIGIMSIMPKTAYFQGISKMWLKINSPTEFFWPQFANLGEQATENQEVYAYTAGDSRTDTFGYLPRYTEYKYANNRVCGKFQTNLDFWHMARKFDTPPALNSDFIESDPTLRNFAVQDPNAEHFYCQVVHKIRAVRPMPYYGTPTF